MFPDELLEGLSFQQLHGDKVAAIGLPDLIDSADIRMIQGRGGPGFTLKTLQRRSVLFQFAGQKLQRNVPAQIDVFGFVHHSHAATAQLLQNAVVRNDFAGNQQ